MPILHRRKLFWTPKSVHDAAGAGGGGAVVLDAVGTELHTNSGTTLSSSSVITIGSGSNRALVATLAFSGIPTGLTVTWNGTSMTQLISSTPSWGAYLFGLRNPASGTNTLTASWTGALELMMSCISFTGVSQTNDGTAFPHTQTGAGVETIDVTSQVGNYVVYTGANTFGRPLTGTTIFQDAAFGVTINGDACYDVGASTVTIGRIGGTTSNVTCCAVDVSF